MNVSLCLKFKDSEFLLNKEIFVQNIKNSIGILNILYENNKILRIALTSNSYKLGILIDLNFTRVYSADTFPLKVMVVWKYTDFQVFNL